MLRKSSPTAFTLIELLVVISIIALLIGILLPVLGQSREQGRQIQCLAQVRGIYVASVAYATDEDGYFPSGPHAGYHGARLPTEITSVSGTPYDGAFNTAFAANGPNTVGLGPALERGRHMTGVGDAWVCPSAVEDMANLGNTYIFRAGTRPQLVGGLTEEQRRTNISANRWEDIRIRGVKVWWISGNNQTPYPPPVGETIRQSQSGNLNSPVFSPASFATLSYDGEDNEPHPLREDFQNLAAANAAFFDGSAALRGTETRIE